MRRYQVRLQGRRWQVVSRDITDPTWTWKIEGTFDTHDEADTFRRHRAKEHIGLLVNNQAAEFIDDTARDSVIFYTYSVDRETPYAMVTWETSDLGFWEHQVTHVEYVLPEDVIEFIEEDLLPTEVVGKVKVVLPASY